MRDTITITMEEYKELLIIKGKYEEIKESNNKPTLWPNYRECGSNPMYVMQSDKNGGET